MEFREANKDVLKTKENIDFEIVMGRIFDRSTRKADRPNRLESFIDEWAWFSLDIDVKETPEARDVVDNWRKNGISNSNFRILWEEYPDWWRRRLAKVRSQAGKTKAVQKKGKQGRVVSAKDGRLGARPPKIF